MHELIVVFVVFDARSVLRSRERAGHRDVLVRLVKARVTLPALLAVDKGERLGWKGNRWLAAGYPCASDDHYGGHGQQCIPESGVHIQGSQRPSEFLFQASTSLMTLPPVSV